MRGFVSDSQRRGFFAKLNGSFEKFSECNSDHFASLGNNRFSSAGCVRFAGEPFDPKRALELLDAGLMDPGTLSVEQKSQIEALQEEQQKARSKALKELDERIARGDTYRPKNLWSDTPEMVQIKIGFKEPKIIKFETRDTAKELDARIKKAVDEGKFSRHVKYPIKEKITMKLVEPEMLDLEYDGEKKTITDPEEIAYIKRTIGYSAAGELDRGTRLNEYDIYGDGRRAMDLMFRGKAKFSSADEISKLENELDKAKTHGRVNPEEYRSMKNLLEVLKKE